MQATESHLTGLARSSQRAALVSAGGALIVFLSLALATWWQIQTNRDLDERNAALHSANAALDQQHRQLKTEIDQRQTLKHELDQAVAARQKTLAELEQRTQQVAAAQADVQDLTDRISAANTPAALQELQQEVVPAPAPPAREAARAEWRAGLTVWKTDPAAAERHFQAATAADPGYAAPYNSLGRLALGRRDFDEAIRLFQESLRRSPTYAPAMYNLAVASDRKGDRAAALKITRKLQQLRPDDGKVAKLLDHLQTPPTRQRVKPPEPMP